MRFTENKAFAVAVLATVALTGLACLQLYLMSRTFFYEAQLFRQNVNAALTSIVQKLETRETVAMVFKASFPDSHIVQRVVTRDADTTAGPLWVLRERDVNRDVRTDSARFVFQTSTDAHNVLLRVSAVTQDRRSIVERVMEEITSQPKIPIARRIDYPALDSLIGVTFKERGLTLPYAYGIVSSDNDSVVLAEPTTLKDKLGRSEYRAQLFPHDIVIDPHKLVAYFPGQTLYLLRQVAASAIIAILFMATLACCFVYVTRTGVRQKQFSTSLVDFINNMTHEFQTPLSTISLTSETLSATQVAEDKNKVRRYARIIQDESGRMRRQVETMLHMAAVEKGDVALSIGRVDVHALIASAIDNFSLAVESRNGAMTTRLAARTHMIEADEVHLGNIIHNLLDNAIKYTREHPEIRIATADAGDLIKITVVDNGIGLRTDEQKRVFDAYYRVPAGNIHEVKGFGLGLSYVKRMVEAHGGRVTVESKEGEGSIFSVVLPVRQS